MLDRIRAYRDQIDPSTLVQNVRWVPERSARAAESMPA